MPVLAKRTFAERAAYTGGTTGANAWRLEQGWVRELDRHGRDTVVHAVCGITNRDRGDGLLHHAAAG